MPTQRFTITSIQRDQVGDAVLAAVSLTPVPSDPPVSPTPMMLNQPSSQRLTALADAETTDWAVGDVIVVTATKEVV